MLWVGAAVLLVCVQVVRAAPEPAGQGGGQAARSVRYVRFDIDGSLPESRPPLYLFSPGQETLYELVGRIDKASLDPDVRGVILRLGPLDAGWGKVQEVREALLRCKKAGKDVVCLIEEAGNVEYYLACSADTIDMAPAGELMLMGLRMEALFARDLLDKVGVKGDFVQVGKYKGGAEPFTRMEPTAAFQESLDALVQDYFDQMVTGMVEGRKMPVSKVGLLIRRGPYSARGALEAGLVDDVLYYDEVVGRLRARYGPGFRVETDYASAKPAASGDAASVLRMLMGLGTPGRPAPSHRPIIAVVHASGPIVRESYDGSLFGAEMASAEDLVALLNKVGGDPRVRAIVLRVDSPGGSALASDLIWRATRLADKRKPVIASFSDTAASGGYYIGSGARKIFAEPGTLTGSIGIFGGKLVLGGLLEKIGVHVAVIEKGGDTGLMSSLEEVHAPAAREAPGPASGRLPALPGPRGGDAGRHDGGAGGAGSAGARVDRRAGAPQRAGGRPGRAARGRPGRQGRSGHRGRRPGGRGAPSALAQPGPVAHVRRGGCAGAGHPRLPLPHPAPRAGAAHLPRLADGAAAGAVRLPAARPHQRAVGAGRQSAFSRCSLS